MIKPSNRNVPTKDKNNNMHNVRIIFLEQNGNVPKIVKNNITNQTEERTMKKKLVSLFLTAAMTCSMMAGARECR